MPRLLFLGALLAVFASEGSKSQNDLFFYFQQGFYRAAYQLVVRTLKEITQNSGGAKLTFLLKSTSNSDYHFS
jgi:uncharacterized BrkB/YihY/UPF0761 family membrane protein